MYHSLMLLAGMLLLYRSTALPSITHILLFLIVSLGFWAFNRFQSRLAAIFIFAYCWAAVFANYSINQNLPSSLINQPIKILGCLINVKNHSDHYQRLLIDVHETYLKGELNKFKGKISLANYQPLELTLSPGSCGEFKVKLKPVHGRLNSRGFDYEAWAYVENIKAIGTLKSVGKLRPGSSLANQYRHFRFSLTNQLKILLDGDISTALVLSLALGDRSLMTQETMGAAQANGDKSLISDFRFTHRAGFLVDINTFFLYLENDSCGQFGFPGPKDRLDCRFSWCRNLSGFDRFTIIRTKGLDNVIDCFGVIAQQ